MLFLQLSAVGQQDNLELIRERLQKSPYDLKTEDIQNLHIDAEHTSSLSGVHHMYMNQTFGGIRIKNATINASINSDNEVVNLVGKPVKNLVSKVNSTVPTVGVQQTIEAVAGRLGIQGDIFVTSEGNGLYSFEIEAGNYRHESKAELVYWLTEEEEAVLAWNFNIDLPDQTHWYDFIVSAENGSELKRIDWQINCAHPEAHGSNSNHICQSSNIKRALRTTLDGSSYTVFPFPVESPNHGVREIVSEPALPQASPFGWHDTNGQPGHEFTITRGNNVYAYEDASDTDSPGSSSEGGNDLNFNFSLNLANDPDSYQDASITNLFYANNVIHDLLYVYGFDEASGNFQDNNYGNGGLSNDEVRAEAQDGEGFDNANMATPGDGSNPRMQMFLWNSGVASGSFTVNAPIAIEGSYLSSAASTFGPAFPSGGLTGDVALVIDDSNPVNNGCSDFVNAAEVNGKIALLFRGGCNFTDKVLLAQEEGAVAVMIINNVVGEDPITPGGTADGINIPSLMISFEVGQNIIDELDNGETVTVTLEDSDGSTLKDGSFDNGIIIHEYVHGLTNRLTGGANNSGCLFADEQMGEGWSDYYAIMMTMDLSIENPVYRPMGTFASGDPVDGNGIRPAPYDTSFAVNAFTYANLPSQNLSIPHGVGFVWCTMLWDMTWLLIDEFGFDPDLVNGTAGNNIALQLVTEALKLQPCGPGFVDGRDAILQADQILYDGAHECLIWKAFAKRGLGLSADQGSSASRADGTAAFDIPSFCFEAVSPPTAAFSASTDVTCTGVVSFTDESINVPQTWLWDFGDGNTSEEQNPTHVYQTSGEYTVSLTVTNTLGNDELIQENLINFSFPENPETENAFGCVGEQIELTGTSTDGNDVRWLNGLGEQVGLGESLNVTVEESPQSFFAQSYSELPEIGFVGPEDNDFGTGGNHGTDFIGTVIIETFQPVIIRSALVYSGEISTRQISLYNGVSTEVVPLETINVDVDFTGAGRIDLNIEIDEPGIYSIGLNEAEFYRNNAGANYPYDLNGVASIIGSSAGEDFYYYFYDLELTTLGCLSEPVEAVVEPTGEADFSFEGTDLTIDFTDNSPEGSSWFWDFGDGNTSNEQNPTHTYETFGEYSVTLTVDGGCSITINVPVGLTSTNNQASDFGFSFYPNPTRDILVVENELFATKQMSVRLVDATGKLVVNEQFVGSRIEVGVDQLPSGIYFLRMMNLEDKSILWTEKVTVME